MLDVNKITKILWMHVNFLMDVNVGWIISFFFLSVNIILLDSKYIILVLLV